MPITLQEIIARDTYGNILYAVLGGLFLLSAFHMVMFFQNRDRSYLLYSCYTMFAFLAYIPAIDSGFLHDIVTGYGLNFQFKQFFTIIFNSLYFLFFAEFLGVRKRSIFWFRVITVPALFFIVVGTVAYVLLRLGYGATFFVVAEQVFIYLITAHTILSFIILMKVRNPLKYYIIFGGVILFLSSIIGERTIRELPFVNIDRTTGDFIYYIGLFLENIAFSFALGHKQRMIYREKVLFSRNFVAQMRKNDRLKEKMSRENEQRLLIENRQMKYLQEISELRLSVLQTQMNPHFIFNALNSIKYYIMENDPQIAVDYLTKFSKLIRTILVASTVKEFTLTQELQTLKMYVEIENLRFQNGIDFQISVAENLDTDKVKLPPMILQPFVENAIVHGVAAVVEKKIAIDVRSHQEAVLIVIKDNGVGRDHALTIPALKESMGLKIVEGMLKNYFDDGYALAYEDLYENGRPAGTAVHLKFAMR